MSNFELRLLRLQLLDLLLQFDLLHAIHNLMLAMSLRVHS